MNTLPTLPRTSRHRLWRTPAQGQILSVTEHINPSGPVLEIAEYQDVTGSPEHRVLHPANAVKVKQVKIIPLEGPTTETMKEIIVTARELGEGMTGDPIGALICAGTKFEELAFRWFTKKERDTQGGGYYKMKFVVEWEDEEAYEGRFDMEYNGTQGGERFNENFPYRLFYMAGLTKHRSDITRDQHQQYIEGTQGVEACAWARKILATHEL